MKLACVAMTLMLLAAAARAQQPTAIESVLSVGDDGSILSVEKLELGSAMREPLRWRMPVALVSAAGVRRLSFVNVLEISDGRENPVRAHIDKRGDQVDVLIPVQPLAGNTVRIAWQVRNAVEFYPDRDELYWAIGRGWSVSCRLASISIVLPDGAVGQASGNLLVAPHLQPLAFQGKTTMLDFANTSIGPAAVDLVFAPGALRRPSPLRRAAWFLKANPIVLFPGVLLLVMAGWRRYMRRGTAEISVVPRYEPPPDLPPAEAGYLIDGRLDPRDLAATLLDLARRGFIRIEAGTPDEGVPYAAPDFVLRLARPMDDWKGAYSYEHVLLFHTFYGGKWTKLSSVSLRFYAVVPMIARMVRDELLRKRLYVDPRVVAARRLAAVLVLVAVMWAAQAAGWFAVAQSGLLAAVAVASFALAALFFSRSVDHRTARGARVFAELRGFQTFLDTVEADQMERVTLDMFERCLPYAVALGVEHHWGATFSTIGSGPPLWWDAAKAGGIPDFVRQVGSPAEPPHPGKRGTPPKFAAHAG